MAATACRDTLGPATHGIERPASASTTTAAVDAASSSDAVPPELVELMDRVRLLPPNLRRDLEPIVAEAQEHARFRSRVLSIARDALVRMRLDLETARFGRNR
jgi:hypothetical protein